MSVRSALLSVATAAPLAIALLAGPATSARAQMYHDELVDHLHRLHVACDQGDRRACIQFGVVIGEHRERRAEWQQTHPQWFWWMH